MREDLTAESSLDFFSPIVKGERVCICVRVSQTFDF